MQKNQIPNIDGVILGLTKEVADKCFAQAATMVDADDWLKSGFVVSTPENDLRYQSQICLKPDSWGFAKRFKKLEVGELTY